jgi:AcrR family transcriptional regulator
MLSGCSVGGVTGPRRANYGRNAAPANHRALLAAALEVFAERGIDAPLSAVAKRAGVGQGSLYRHFPDRVSLALAAFEDNVVELEAMAAEPECTLDGLLAEITRQTIESVAFVDIVITSPADERMEAVAQRVRATLAVGLRHARRTKAVRRSLTVDDIMVAVGMVTALVARTPPPGRRRAADAAWSLLRRGMRA